MRKRVISMVLGVFIMAAAVTAAAAAEPIRIPAPVTGPIIGEYGPTEARANSPERFGVLFQTTPGTPVHAVADGVVIDVELPDAGDQTPRTRITIEHENGLTAEYSVQSSLVNVMDFVETGTIIGRAGNSLHFETMENGYPMNPRQYLEN